MRREKLGSLGLALLLLVAAAWMAIPFRNESLRRLAPSGVSWDAALHALSGLDLFDDIRLLRPLDALGDVLSQSWWGPLFALVSVPFYALFGRALATASLPSFVAFLLVAPAAFLAARAALGRLPAFESIALAALTGAFILRAPMLLETSSWIMLESLGGLLAVVALGLSSFEDARARRTAFGVAASLFFLKYHDGFFALVTLGAAAWLAEHRDCRRRCRESLLSAIPRRAALALGALSLVLVASRVVFERRGGDAFSRLLPSVPNTLWAMFAVATVFVVTHRVKFLETWHMAPATLRDFTLFGLLPPAVWSLDPAHVRAWFRQTFQATDAPVRSPLAQAASYLEFLRADYALSALPFALVLLGLGLALALPGASGRRRLAVFAVWPILLMSLNPYPAEARFLGCLVPALLAAAAAGLVALGERLPRVVGRAFLLVVLAVLAATFAADGGKWRREAETRATYRYPYDEVGQRAVEAGFAAAPASGPVRLVLPADPPVWPTVRLGFRLVRPGVPPVDVSVEAR